MTEPRAPLYHRHRFPGEIIAEAVWLYFRFPLSFRMVEDMLAYRGIIVAVSQIFDWTLMQSVIIIAVVAASFTAVGQLLAIPP